MANEATKEFCSRCGNEIISKANHIKILYGDHHFVEIDISYFSKSVFYGDLCSQCSIELLTEGIQKMQADYVKKYKAQPCV